ncbi:MAG: hypothetical protein LBJ63_06315 [Prevotellaceae bacterium]|jgi:hypothetical protein|nr:hypothetical protein [Prevotellaceae bacterium]
MTQKTLKTAIIAIIAMFMANIANAQMKVAILDFKAGAGVEQADVDGVSSMFGTYFIDPQKFTLVERTQIDRVIAEQGFQYSALTNQQMVRIGQILNIQKIVVGDITVVSGQYNVDVRVVDVETGAVNATDGATWARSTSYRELMKNLATRLMTKMNVVIGAATTNVTPTVKPNSIVTLLGYLHVFPEDLGNFTSVPNNIIDALNNDVSNGYNTWRLPTNEELSLIENNKSRVQGLTNSDYMTIENNRAGRVRLVTNRETQQERDEIYEAIMNRFPQDSLLNSLFNSRKTYNHSDTLEVYIQLHLFYVIYLDWPNVHLSLAKFFGEQKDYDKAIKHAKKALEIQPDYDEAMHVLTYIYVCDYETYNNNKSTEMMEKYAKQAARFGNEVCRNFCNANNWSY